MSERCLLKIRSTIIPSPIDLSKVGCEGLINALIHPPMLLPCATNAAEEDDGTKKREHNGNSGEIQNTRSLKSVRLIMTPLIGIMLSNCDVSVRMSCLNTWCYLLPRLDTSLNDSSMINRVVDPMFEAAFQLDPNGKSFWATDPCVSLLDDFISAKCSDFGKDKSLKFLQLWIYRRPKFSWKNFRSIQMVKTEEQMEYKYGEACFRFCF
ncbi:uncharacterized protein LOC133713583 isoform X2 [Rosa rugosa]|uniref:uncharacterized protein LOC133713583 isoform X2 n=1 Tax=Rosa rugosa TaxID=74645 RepID=UPI002B40A9FC|nr:uncharacterized protein LOC133713583 isoform X2 [Rosa rugosa]